MIRRDNFHEMQVESLKRAQLTSHIHDFTEFADAGRWCGRVVRVHVTLIAARLVTIVNRRFREDASVVVSPVAAASGS